MYLEIRTDDPAELSLGILHMPLCFVHGDTFPVRSTLVRLSGLVALESFCLQSMTERHCVAYQTLATPPALAVTRRTVKS